MLHRGIKKCVDCSIADVLQDRASSMVDDLSLASGVRGRPETGVRNEHPPFVS